MECKDAHITKKQMISTRPEGLSKYAERRFNTLRQICRFFRSEFNERPPRSSYGLPLTSYHVSLSLYVSYSVVYASHAERSPERKPVKFSVMETAFSCA
jgi:hypothetical protein